MKTYSDIVREFEVTLTDRECGDVRIDIKHPILGESISFKDSTHAAGWANALVSDKASRLFDDLYLD